MRIWSRWALLLALWPGILLSQRSVFFAQNMPPASSGCGAVGTPCVDNFTGTSGANLASPPWTMYLGSGYAVPTYYEAGGLSGTNGTGFASYTSGTFGSNQYSQFVLSGGVAGGPGVRTTSSGNGYIWFIEYNKIAIYAAGVYTSDFGGGCPTPSNGDTIRLSVSGSTLTCTDVTTSTSMSYTDTTYTTGVPGFVLDVSEAMRGPFQADSQ